MVFNWDSVKGMPWRARNAATEAALREYLGRTPASVTLATMELATRLVGSGYTGAGKPDVAVAELAQLLSRLAPYMPMATHDGEVIIRYGKKWRRWQWHGQEPYTAEDKVREELANDPRCYD